MEVVELKLVVEEVVVDVFDLGNDCSGILETVFGHGDREVDRGDRARASVAHGNANDAASAPRAGEGE